MKSKEVGAKSNLGKASESPSSAKQDGEGIYVVQRHQARNLHWDLRLEKDGVLVSWAVPKEPPTVKGVRRLALQVEDHAVDYATFEGCFEFYTTVMTEHGPERIGKIVNNREQVRVLSYNQKADSLEMKPVIGWFKNGRTKDFLRIRIPGQFGGKRVVTVTPNHKIYTPSGIKSASDLQVGDDAFVPGRRWSQEQLQILLGTLLGDAHLQLSRETGVPQYQLVHSGKQRTYLAFVRDMLCPHSLITKRRSSDSYEFRFTDASLIDMYSKLYERKRKVATKEVLEKLDERGLAVWYMDDGYLSARRYAELCTQGFGQTGNEAISEYLNENWELDSTVYYSKPRRKSGGGFFIHLSRLGSARFLTLVNNFLLDELRYKTYFRHHRLDWKHDAPTRTIVPARILSIEHASMKQIRSQQRYDLQVKGNHNYFAGPMLVSNSIPEGEYGAGTVEIWDRGTFQTERWSDKEIVVHIKGQRLTGRYCLVRFAKVENGWLFFKCES